MTTDFDRLKAMVAREAVLGEFPPGGAASGVVAKARRAATPSPEARAFARAARVLAAAEALIVAERVYREACQTYAAVAMRERHNAQPCHRAWLAKETTMLARCKAIDALMSAGEP